MSTGSIGFLRHMCGLKIIYDVSLPFTPLLLRTGLYCRYCRRAHPAARPARQSADLSLTELLCAVVYGPIFAAW